MTDAAWLYRGRLRSRRDLQMTVSGDATVVKDPLSLEYFRFGDRERFLLETLTEPHTVAELTRRYRQRFPNERSTGPQVLAFCASLYECALLLSDQPVTQREGDRRGRQDTPWYTAILSPLAIRLPGVDPTPLLRRLEWLGAVVFSRFFVLLLIAAVAVVCIGFVGQAERLSREVLQLADLMDPAYALMAIVAALITKAWHELGHAVACRRLGAECHEMGVVLLALFPCLYCDVSDAWTLPSRWQRALVALAGVYFEVMLAVLAASAWMLLAPGPLAVSALYVVVTASISTVIVNLNPLIRFDGYYVLADVWGVSNLHQQSRSALWGPLRRWVRGDSGAEEPLDASPILLAVYGLVSTIYGWCLLAIILWFTYQVLSDAGFAAVGDMLVAITLGGVAIVAARSTLGLVPRTPGGRSIGAMARFAASASIALGGGIWIATLSLEQALYARCRVESKTFADIVAPSDGLLHSRVSYGDHVERGDLIAELVDPADELRRLELLERESALLADLEGLRTRSQSDAALLSEIARLQPTLVEVRHRIRSHQTEVADKRLCAPLTGRIERSGRRADSHELETVEGDLVTWGGLSLDRVNRGCTLREGESLCRVVGPGLQAVLLLNEDDSGLVQIGNLVRIALDRSPGQPLQGKVLDVSLSAAAGGLPDDEERLEDTLRARLDRGAVYRVTVSLSHDEQVQAQPGALGQARIVTGRETVFGRGKRWLQRLFRLG